MHRAFLPYLFAIACLACLQVTGGGPPAFAQKPDDPPAKQRNPYELRMVRVGNTFQGIRFKPASGETWIIAGNQWEKLPESGPVPAGDYEVILVATDEDFTAFRFDRRTGTTWQLQRRKWVKVEEPGVRLRKEE